MNQIRRVKGSMLTFKVRSPSFSDSLIPLKRLSRKHDIKTLIMSHTTVVQKGSEHRLRQKTEGKRKEELWTGIQHEWFKKLFNSRLTRKQRPWIMDMPPEVVKQLLDTGPKCSSFRSPRVFWQSVLRTFLYHCRMAHDGGFWDHVFWKISLQESEMHRGRTMNVSIKPFTRLIWFMTLIVEFKTLPVFYIIVFGHNMLPLVMVVIYNE